MSHITLTKSELLLREVPGHGYVVDQAPSRSGNPRIMEVWLTPDNQRAAGRIHNTLFGAIDHTLRQMQRDLRQKDAQVRSNASPVKMHMSMSMGRPVDWTSARREVTRVAGRLGDVERFIQAGSRFRQVPDERLAREVQIYRAPLDIVLALEQISVQGAKLDAGSIVVQVNEEGDRRLVVGEMALTLIPGRVTAVSFPLLDPTTGNVVDRISALDARELLDGQHDGLRMSDEPPMAHEGVAP